MWPSLSQESEGGGVEGTIKERNVCTRYAGSLCEFNGIESCSDCKNRYTCVHMSCVHMSCVHMSCVHMWTDLYTYIQLHSCHYAKCSCTPCLSPSAMSYSLLSPYIPGFHTGFSVWGGGEFSVKFSQKFIIWPKFY